MFNYFKILLALTLLVTPFSDRLIDVTTMGGTYIIGCICKNGIVIGADSRTSWLDNSGNVVAYDDMTKKVFTFNNIVFTRAGSSSFADANLTFNGVFKKLLN